MQAIEALKADPEWQAAMRRRGIDDFDQVQIDPWPAGSFGLAHEEGRRICRCLSYLRETPGDNGYARPVEGVIGFVDMGRGEVLEVVDTGVVPLPPERGSYYPEDSRRCAPTSSPSRSPSPRARASPWRATWSAGSGGRCGCPWTRWRAWCCTPSATRTRAGCARSSTGPSVSEMVVPYGDPGPMHGWKNAFDAGEWGLGRMANSLTLGCDCLGEIHYFDAVFADERGQPHTLRQRHLHARGGLRDPLEARRPAHRPDRGPPLAAAGGQLHRHRGQLRVRLLLVLLPRRHHPARGEAHRHHVDHGRRGRRRAPLRHRGRAPAGRPLPPAPVQRPPRHGGRRPGQLRLRGGEPARSAPGRTTPGPTPSTRWPPCSRPSRRPSGWSTRPAAGTGGSSTTASPTASASRWPTSWCPGPTPTLLADPGSSVGRRARFATKNLWVTPFDPRRAAGGRRPPQPARRGRRPAPLDGGRPARSSTATWWSGTPSGSPTSPGPRTGRSCRSSTPAFTSCPWASSTATRPSTCPANDHCHDA